MTPNQPTRRRSLLATLRDFLGEPSVGQPPHTFRPALEELEIRQVPTITGTPSQVLDLNPGSVQAFPSDLTNVNGTLFFAANDGVLGFELFKSDGTASGTTLVKDINPGSLGSG